MIFNSKIDRFRNMLSNRFLDGEVCSCGQVHNEDDLYACELCGGYCCDDCTINCAECDSLTCSDCKSLFERTVCQNCEEPYININYDNSQELDPNTRLFLMVEGTEYPVRNSSTALELIENTNPMLAYSKRTSYIDIKGLGLLKYSYRSVQYSKGKTDYHLTFEPIRATHDLPFD